MRPHLDQDGSATYACLCPCILTSPHVGTLKMDLRGHWASLFLVWPH